MYVHIGESHRGYLGSGTVDFDNFFKALGHIGYDGPIVFESFSTAVVDPKLSRMLAVWRNLWDDSDDLGAHANTFNRYAHTWPTAIDLVSSGRIDVTPLITHHFTLDESADAIMLGRTNPESIKAILHPQR